MTITCIIATFNREQLLVRAVESVLQQQVDAEFEVIVLNDAGEPLQPADWQKDSRVQVYNTNSVERCFVRNAGASMARGEWLHFLDDDDYMLPGAYSALLEIPRNPNVHWLYAAYNCVDDDGELIQNISPTLEGDLYALAVADIGIPLGASLINREAFLSAGGFDPYLIPGEDRELIQRISLSGTFAACQDIVISVRVGVNGATTTPWSLSTKMSRMMREKCFCNPRCLPRVFETLPMDGGRDIVRGRLVRFYGVSAIRNMRRSPLTALSRTMVAMRFCLAGIPSGRFFRGLCGGW
ncbi:glycosyltransferase family 2 protein [bacterium]|nr:glycosyltransferase family 2 protein [bacterium]